MCKLFAVTSLANLPESDLNKLIKVSRDAVCKTRDKDGFGYAVQSDSGLFGERTVTPFQWAPRMTAKRRLPVVSAQSDSFGKPIKGALGAFTAHGRMSTNTVALDCTHPFVGPDNSFALSHNGVVSDPDAEVSHLLKTPCDTEILSHLWQDGGMDSIERYAAGYYVLTILDTKGQLHLARDSRASLYLAWSETLQAYLAATTPGIIYQVSKKMQWRIDATEPMLADTYAVFRGNDLTYSAPITPRGFEPSKVFSLAADKALGSYPAFDYQTVQEYLATDRQEYSEDDKGFEEFEFQDDLVVVKKGA